jgi:hypothetical protein
MKFKSFASTLALQHVVWLPFAYQCSRADLALLQAGNGLA